MCGYVVLIFRTKANGKYVDSLLQDENLNVAVFLSSYWHMNKIAPVATPSTTYDTDYHLPIEHDRYCTFSFHWIPHRCLQLSNSVFLWLIQHSDGRRAIKNNNITILNKPITRRLIPQQPKTPPLGRLSACVWRGGGGDRRRRRLLDYFFTRLFVGRCMRITRNKNG